MHRQRGRSGSTSGCWTACTIGSSRKNESSKLTTCYLWKEEEDVEQREGSDIWARESEYDLWKINSVAVWNIDAPKVTQPKLFRCLRSNLEEERLSRWLNVRCAKQVCGQAGK